MLIPSQQSLTSVPTGRGQEPLLQFFTRNQNSNPIRSTMSIVVFQMAEEGNRYFNSSEEATRQNNDVYSSAPSGRGRVPCFQVRMKNQNAHLRTIMFVVVFQIVEEGNRYFSFS